MMSFVAIQAGAALTLVCSGTLRSGPVGIDLPEAEGEAFEITYRIDLAARRWCSDSCESREPIASLEGAYIVLRDRQTGAGSHVITVFPAARRFADTLIQGDRTTLRSGQCRPVGFSNIPDRIA